MVQGGGGINDQELARLIVASASARRESRGAHYRSDFPLPEAEPLYTVRVQRSAAGLSVRREPVALTRATPEGSAAAPALIEIGD